LPPPPPAWVDQMLREVSPQRLRADVDRLAAFGTRHTLSATDHPTRGIGAARRWILEEFQKAADASGRPAAEAMRVKFEPWPVEPDGRRIDVPVEVVNVVAEIPGRLENDGVAPAPRVYVLGHYDSRASNEMDREIDAPGANDDGSGTALVIELVRVLSKQRFDCTVVLIATAGEEQGLIGARKHAAWASAGGIDIRAVLSSDIIGDPTSPGGVVHADRVRVLSEGVPAVAMGSDDARGGGRLMFERLRRESALGESSSRQLARAIDAIARLHRTEVRPMLIFRADRFLRGGDHTPFHEAGFPAVRFTEVEEDYSRQHQDVRTENGARFGDVPEFVDENYLAGVVRLNAAATAHLANAPAPPANARLITANLANSTTLRWAPSTEADIAGYEVVWRATTSPDWEHAQDVGLVAEATLPVSKDNFFLGVRAYDRDGFRSLVSFPLAARE
ncbi:MAG TPA: aminopeptidase, partial [Phycisphaerales bacterium]|nr:aminopeptidase [Phycisphaerales bacterium]